MNREIKFRVWDKAVNKFYHPSCFAIRADGTYDCLDGYYGKTFLGVYNLDRFAIQQFTTRKDSKGAEIYEGDIVNVNGGNHIIEWRGAGFAATWSDYNLDTCWFVGGGPVVVGNIFENPELAEKARKHPRA